VTRGAREGLRPCVPELLVDRLHHLPQRLDRAPVARGDGHAQELLGSGRQRRPAHPRRRREVKDPIVEFEPFVVRADVLERGECRVRIGNSSALLHAEQTGRVRRGAVWTGPTRGVEGRKGKRPAVEAGSRVGLSTKRGTRRTNGPRGLVIGGAPHSRSARCVSPTQASFLRIPMLRALDHERIHQVLPLRVLGRWAGDGVDLLRHSRRFLPRVSRPLTPAPATIA